MRLFIIPKIFYITVFTWFSPSGASTRQLFFLCYVHHDISLYQTRTLSCIRLGEFVLSDTLFPLVSP